MNRGIISAHCAEITDFPTVLRVRSSVARRLKIETASAAVSGQDVEGVVEMMLDATQQYGSPVTVERLFEWHTALFPEENNRDKLQPIRVGAGRDDRNGLMQVVSSHKIGRYRVHCEAPAASRLDHEMTGFLAWFNAETERDPLLKAAIVHLWFVTIHPFIR